MPALRYFLTFLFACSYIPLPLPFFIEKNKQDHGTNRGLARPPKSRRQSSVSRKCQSVDQEVWLAVHDPAGSKQTQEPVHISGEEEDEDDENPCTRHQD